MDDLDPGIKAQSDKTSSTFALMSVFDKRQNKRAFFLFNVLDLREAFPPLFTSNFGKEHNIFQLKIFIFLLRSKLIKNKIEMCFSSE